MSPAWALRATAPLGVAGGRRRRKDHDRRRGRRAGALGGGHAHGAGHGGARHAGTEHGVAPRPNWSGHVVPLAVAAVEAHLPRGSEATADDPERAAAPGALPGGAAAHAADLADLR